LTKIAQAWFPSGRQSLDLAQRIAALSLPVQIIWGRDDRIIPVAHAEALGSRLPIHILEQAGHLPHIEKAGEVNLLISRFVES
jgi:pyruvate dehydrogenase E2 component (dihydrolipoamide acetyltransferase)